MIKIFTPTFADSSNNNAQNLTVKSIVSRLDPGVFDILMLSESDNIDSRLVNRKNFHYIKLGSHNRTLKIIAYLIKYRPHIYFYPTFTHIDQIFLHLKSYLNSNMSIVTHIVHTVDENHESAMTPHSKKLREILAASDFIAGNSNYVSHTVERFMKHKSSTIHNGIECEIFYPDNPRSYQGPKKVLYAGSFQSRKRPDVVIEIANRFPNLDFTLIGDGEIKEDCIKLAAELKCRNVKFEENLSQIELANHMRSSDIFLFPSIHEGHPQVLGQASACGCICIAMNDYRPDYIINKESGFLVNKDYELIENIKLLIENPDIMKSMRLKAIEHSKSFDWDISSHDWSKAFMKLAG